MTRAQTIELILRQIYGGFPTEDSNITQNLVNLWLNQGCAVAAKQNYKDNISIDNMGYINNSFYATFSGLPIIQDTTDNQCWLFTLPQIPLGVSKNRGLSEVRFVGTNGQTSFPGIPLSIDQWSYYRRLQPIQNKIAFLPEGAVVRSVTPIQLNGYTATVKMVSGGDSTNLNSILLIPDDYMPVVISYVKEQLAWERGQPQSRANDGEDSNAQIPSA